MTVTKISEFKARDTIEALEELLALAKSGQLTGLVYAGKLNNWHHGIGITGDYAKDPIPALGVAGRLLRLIGRYADVYTETR